MNTHSHKYISLSLSPSVPLQDVAAHPKLSALLEHKYVVHLSDAAYSYLLRYLQSDDHGALCRVLSTHLQLEVMPTPRTHYQLYGNAPGNNTTNNTSASNTSGACLILYLYRIVYFF